VMEGSTRVSAEASAADELQAAKDFGASSPSPQHWPSEPAPVAPTASHLDPVAVEAPRAPVAESTHVTSPFVAEPTPPPAMEVARAETPRGPVPAPVPRQVERAAPTPVALPPTSDLVMVETRFTATTASETEAPAAPRPRRERRPTTTLPDEPLQMVETRKDQPSP
jgi:hypothetical protein